MSQERVEGIDRLLAEDELSYVVRQRKFLINQISSLRSCRMNRVAANIRLDLLENRLPLHLGKAHSFFANLPFNVPVK